MAILRPPAGFHNYLGALPDGVAVRDRARGPLDVILFFVTRRSELERRFASSDLPHGLVDTKVCALDDIWSGLKLVIRLENR